jgi:hypothetical protein
MDLHIGSSSPRVRELEKRLKAEGFLKGSADEKFDKKTGAAVVAYKEANGWDNKPKPEVHGRMAASIGMTGDSFDGAKAQPKKLKGGTYNCLIGRDPDVVKKTVSGFVHNQKLDFLQVQEISQYHHALESIPGYHLITFPKSKDHGESGVLVRDGLEAKSPKSIEAATGWTAVTGHPAAPRAATSVKLGGWLNVTSVHLPPAIDFKNGHIVGPAARVKSYLSSMQKLLGFAKRQDGAMLIGGDWNEGPNTTGVGSPNWLAKMAGMKKSAGGPIDWEMARGAKVSNVKVGPHGGSDHRLVTYTVSR